MAAMNQVEEDSHDWSYEELECMLAKSRAQIVELRKQLGLEEKLKSSLTQAKHRAVKSKSVDACFVFDCTDSMHCHLTLAKQKIIEIQRYILDWWGCEASVKFGFVGFRDFEAPTPFEILPFTNDTRKLQTFLDRITAQSFPGHDDAEDVIGGLNEAASMNWTASTRILYLICDAPAHGTRFHGGRVDDNYPHDSQQFECTDSLFTTMSALRIHFIGIEFEHRASQMFQVFRELRSSNDDGLTTLVLRADRPDADLVRCVIDGCVASLSSSLTLLSSSAHCKARKDCIQRDFPLEQLDWCNAETWPQEYVNVTSLFLNDADNKLSEHTVTRRLRMRRLPFARGGMRHAFPAEDVDRGTRLVVKVYKVEDSNFDSSAPVMADVRAQVLADYFARQFSQRLPQMPLQFIQVQAMKRPHGSDFEWCALEEFIEGEYTKYTNNNGYVSKDSELAQTFSHFTWQSSGGEIMVTDIQGMRSCVLTDPQIHCEGSSQFGRGNLGVRGMDNFFMQHCCGELCRLLQLTPNPMQRGQGIGSWPASSSGAPPSLPGQINFAGGFRSDSFVTQDSLSVAPLDSGPFEAGPLQCEGKCQTSVWVKDEEYVREMKQFNGVFCKGCKEKVKNSMSRVPCSREGCRGYVTFSIFVLDVKGCAPPKYCGICRSEHKKEGDDFKWFLV